MKQQMFCQMWKFQLDTLIINHFIIKYILYGMVFVDFYDFPPRHCFSMWLNILQYTFGKVHRSQIPT